MDIDRSTVKRSTVNSRQLELTLVAAWKKVEVSMTSGGRSVMADDPSKARRIVRQIKSPRMRGGAAFCTAACDPREVIGRDSSRVSQSDL